MYRKFPKMFGGSQNLEGVGCVDKSLNRINLLIFKTKRGKSVNALGINLKSQQMQLIMHQGRTFSALSIKQHNKTE